MSYRFALRQDGHLLVIVFQGEISPAEERQALVEIASLPGLEPDARVLVDRRQAKMTVGPEHVEPHLELVRRSFQTEGQPRMALVLARDYDYGMSRMLELTSPDRPHDLGVFRSLDEACEWLDIEARDIEWP